MLKKITQTLYLFAFGLCLFLFFACDNRIYDTIDPCPLNLHFKYDYNMKYADAFSHEVKKVDVFIFDKNGTFLKRETVEHSNHLSLTLIPGTYNIVAWAGLYDASYQPVNLTANKSTMDDLRVQIKTNQNITDKQLDPLWHGALRNLTLTGDPYHTDTVSLVKDTKTFRFILYSDNSKQKINVNKYDFELVAENGLYDNDNNPIGKTKTTYKPYAVGNFSTDGPKEKYPGSWVEMNTLRLMEKKPTTLIIKKKDTGEKLFEADINNFLLDLRLISQKTSMSVQEFFDREDVYKVVFILKDNADDPNLLFERFLIEVNGWLIRMQTADGL